MEGRQFRTHYEMKGKFLSMYLYIDELTIVHYAIFSGIPMFGCGVALAGLGRRPGRVDFQFNVNSEGNLLMFHSLNVLIYAMLRLY